MPAEIEFANQEVFEKLLSIAAELKPKQEFEIDQALNYLKEDPFLGELPAAAIGGLRIERYLGERQFFSLTYDVEKSESSDPKVIITSVAVFSKI